MMWNEVGYRHGVLIIGIVLGFAMTLQPPPPKATLTEGLNILWTDTGYVASLDFQYGIGGTEGQPQPPFRFLNEDSSGSSPKVNVSDGGGRRWNVKWGPEANPGTFCTRLLWACGYFAETEYFIARGRIDGAHDLTLAHPFIAKDCIFEKYRYQLRKDSPKHLKSEHWTWTKNPFVGTPQLKGLKILLLLVSNWDTKEANLSICEDDSTGDPRSFYADHHWTASLAK